MGALSAKQRAAHEAADARKAARQDLSGLSAHQQRAWVATSEYRLTLNDIRARHGMASLEQMFEASPDHGLTLMPAALVQPPNQEDTVYLKEVLTELLSAEGPSGAQAFLNECEGTERSDRLARAHRSHVRAHLIDWSLV